MILDLVFLFIYIQIIKKQYLLNLLISFTKELLNLFRA
jgi:hypothetical protein